MPAAAAAVLQPGGVVEHQLRRGGQAASGVRHVHLPRRPRARHVQLVQLLQPGRPRHEARPGDSRRQHLAPCEYARS